MPTVSTRHGVFDYEDSQVFRVLGGLIGFPEVSRFILLESQDIEPLRWMVSVDDSALSLLVVDPRKLVPDFRIALGEGDRTRLRIGDAADVLPLAIAVVGDRPEAATCNLKAPIVINSSQMLAAQVVLTDSDYSVQHPLLGERRD